MSKKVHKIAVWGILVIILAISSLIDWNPMEAAEQLYSQPNEIVIKARMPFTEEFAFALAKNSRVMLENKKYLPGDQVEVKVVSMAAQDKPLKNQKLKLSILNKETGAETLIIGGMENESREVVFQFSADENMAGNNSVVVTNQTYEKEVVLKDQPKFKFGSGKVEKKNDEVWNKFLSQLFSWMKIG
jgi:hypothetical protein